MAVKLAKKQMPPKKILLLSECLELRILKITEVFN